MSKDKWIQMPHPGHFICSSQCRFVINTYVNGYIVSTVGEYVPDSAVRRIIREVRGWPLNLKGDEEERDFIKLTGGGDDLGYNRKYETMVFRAKKSNEKCCPYLQADGTELDSLGYNKSSEATKGHFRLCNKWDKKRRRQ